VGPLLGSVLNGGMVVQSEPADFVTTMQFDSTLSENLSMSFSYINYANKYQFQGIRRIPARHGGQVYVLLED